MGTRDKTLKISVGNLPGQTRVKITPLIPKSKPKVAHNGRMTQVVAINMSRAAPDDASAYRKQDPEIRTVVVNSSRQAIEAYMAETRQFVSSMAAEYYAGMVLQTAHSLANPQVRADYFSKDKGGDRKTDWKANLSYFVPLIVGKQEWYDQGGALTKASKAHTHFIRQEVNPGTRRAVADLERYVGQIYKKEFTTFDVSSGAGSNSPYFQIDREGNRAVYPISPYQASIRKRVEGEDGKKSIVVQPVPLSGIVAYSLDTHFRVISSRTQVERNMQQGGKDFSQARPGFPYAVDREQRDEPNLELERTLKETQEFAAGAGKNSPHTEARIKDLREQVKATRRAEWRRPSGQVTANLSGQWRKLGKDYYKSQGIWSETIDQRMQYVKRRFPGIVFDYSEPYLNRAEKQQNTVSTRPASLHYWKKTGLLSKLMNQYVRSNYEKLRLPTRYVSYDKPAIVEFPKDAKVVRGNQVAITFPKLGNQALNLILRKSFVTGKSVTQSEISSIIDKALLQRPDFGGNLNKIDRLAYAEYLRPLYGKFAATAGKQFKTDVANVLRLGQTKNPSFQVRK